MRIGKRIFPYPTLNRDESYSNIVNSKFNLCDDYELNYDDGYFMIKNVYYEITDNEIKKLITDGIIKVLLVMESSTTIFRESFILEEKPKDIFINIDDLKDRVEISAYGVLNSEVKNFSLKNFNEYYQGFKFDLNKHNIILIDDGFSVNLEYDESEDDLITSIFSVVKDMDNTEIITVTSKINKIIITLPEEQFNIYDQSKRHSSLTEIYFTNLLIPALLQELTLIKEQVINDEEGRKYQDVEDVISDYYWFSSIRNQYENIYEEKLSIETIKNMDVLNVSQRLINNPITKSFDQAYELLTLGGYDEED